MSGHKPCLSSLILLTFACFHITTSQENGVGTLSDDVKATTYLVSAADVLLETTSVQRSTAPSETTWVDGRDHVSSTTDYGMSSSPLWQSSVPAVTSDISSTWRPPESSSTTNDLNETGSNSVHPIVNPSKDDDRRISSSKSISDLIVSTEESKGKQQPVTEKMPTEGAPSAENDESEWANMDYCELTEVECVEPVQCKGKGSVDCSPQDKLPWLSDEHNSSLIDQLLPREPRLRRAANTKWSKDRKRNPGAGNRNHNLPNSQDEDEDLDKEPCRTEETLLCTAELNIVNCRGTGRCDAAAPDDATGSYLAEWEIAVIAVLTLAGLLLVVFLVYIIYGA